MIRVQLLDSRAKVPTRATPFAAGLDLYALESGVIFPNLAHRINTGVAIEIPAGYAGFIWPRSGMASRFGMDILGGVIDSDYRGEIIVMVKTLRECHFARGDRMAQLVIQPVSGEQDIMVVPCLTNTERGNDGFGSTGA